MLRRLLDLLLPPKCPLCRREVDEHGQWCLGCLAAVASPRRLALISSASALDDCFVVCRYSGGLRRLLRDLKFRSIRRYKPHFLWLLNYCLAYDNPEKARHIITGALADISPVAVPVPLDAGRLSARGFNQTELIFREWVEQRRWLWREALIRVRPTAPQWELGRAQRERNLRGAFAVPVPAEVRGRQVLLLDDIVTSGATLGECARALKKAGAARVTGLALAGEGVG